MFAINCIFHLSYISYNCIFLTFQLQSFIHVLLILKSVNFRLKSTLKQVDNRLKRSVENLAYEIKHIGNLSNGTTLLNRVLRTWFMGGTYWQLWQWYNIAEQNCFNSGYPSRYLHWRNRNWPMSDLSVLTEQQSRRYSPCIHSQTLFVLYTLFLKEWILLTATKFWKPIGSSKIIRHPRWDFLHQLTVQGVVSSHPRPPVAYNCCVSVFIQANARIDPATQQLIGETCTCRHTSTSATAGFWRSDYR